jgi:hypothetical protein
MYNFAAVRFFLKAIAILIFFTAAWNSEAQILDDSTVNIYGPQTTRYFLEQDLLNSDTLYHPIDTVLNKFHRYTFVQKTGYRFVDLGIPGTATRPLYSPFFPSEIGFRSGYNAYDLYSLNPIKNKYYDTKSPYSKFDIVIGGNGVSVLATEFSRNVTRDWNLGFTFNRYISTQQFGFVNRRDREADNSSFSIYTAYKTKNDKYRVLANVTKMDHKVNESGGAVYDDITETFEVNEHKRALSNAQSQDARFNGHLYHRFQTIRNVFVYHISDYQTQRLRYSDNSGNLNLDVYPGVNYDSTATYDSTRYQTYKNEIGVHGGLGFFNFRFYYKRKDYFVDYARVPDLKPQTDEIGGAYGGLDFGKLGKLSGEIEFLGNSSYLPNHDYLFRATFTSGWLNGIAERINYSPSNLETRYFGNHFEWQNSFLNTSLDYLQAQLSIKTPLVKFFPGMEFFHFNNLVYFNEAAIPVQYDGDIIYLVPSAELHLDMGVFHWHTRANYNLADNTIPYRIPEITGNSLLFFENKYREKNIWFQIGIDAEYKSGYYAAAFMPVTQQFYKQSSFFVDQALVADVFINMKVNRVRVFLRGSNLNQGVPAKGYFTAPGYLGIGRAVSFGVNWMFFD